MKNQESLICHTAILRRGSTSAARNSASTLFHLGGKGGGRSAPIVLNQRKEHLFQTAISRKQSDLDTWIGSLSEDFWENLILGPFLSKSLPPGVQEKAWGQICPPPSGVVRSKKKTGFIGLKGIIVMVFSAVSGSNLNICWFYSNVFILAGNISVFLPYNISVILACNCSSQQSIVHWLSSPIFPCSSFVW